MTAIEVYLNDVRRVRASKAHTSERSFYPALTALVNAIGGRLSPAMTAVSDPRGRSGDFPDIAILEKPSQVMALPVEVKGPDTSAEVLLSLDQGRRYAASFGGGMVLLTNLHQLVLAELGRTGLWGSCLASR